MLYRRLKAQLMLWICSRLQDCGILDLLLLLTVLSTCVPELDAKGLFAMGEGFGCELNSYCVERMLGSDLLTEFLD
jgi:hypothetical protein